MKKKKNAKKSLIERYHDPREPGALRGLQRFAAAQKRSTKKVREVLENDLGYTLHKPRRR